MLLVSISSENLVSPSIQASAAKLHVIQAWTPTPFSLDLDPNLPSPPLNHHTTSLPVQPKQATKKPKHQRAPVNREDNTEQRREQRNQRCFEQQRAPPLLFVATSYLRRVSLSSTPTSSLREKVSKKREGEGRLRCFGEEGRVIGIAGGGGDKSGIIEK
ncbi:hypothetical protein E2542_SST14543 [Spatholobus suberectus]|nr:hypothetical protein E2542_SST14543 [Spatholobus suberectus]